MSKVNRSGWIRGTGKWWGVWKVMPKIDPPLIPQDMVGLWWAGILQPIWPGSAVNNHLRAPAAQSIWPSEAMTSTTSVTVSPLGSSGYIPNAYGYWFLTSLWMTTVPGVLPVTPSASYLATGSACIPGIQACAVCRIRSSPRPYHLVPGVHLRPIMFLGRVHSGTLVLPWDIQGRQSLSAH